MNDDTAAAALASARAVIVKAIREALGPPIGNPEFISKHADRLEARQQQAAEQWTDVSLAALDRAGWALVPKVPTEAMVLAGDDAVVAGIQPAAILEQPWHSPAERCWTAMLVAAPKEPGQ